MIRKRAAEDANSRQFRKKAKSPREINSRTDFSSEFGSRFDVARSPSLQMTSWNTEQGYQQIRKWLVGNGDHFVSLYESIDHNSEAGLYPFVVNALCPLLEAGQFVGEATIAARTTLSDEQIDEVVDAVVAQSRQSSQSVSGELEVSTHIDTTSEPDVRRFVIALEETIRSLEFDDVGRVELVVHNRGEELGKDKVVVVEVKPEIRSHNDAGFFQVASYMVLGSVKYGIYTSHKEWMFLRMDKAPSATEGEPERHVIHFTKPINFLRANWEMLDEDAVVVYAYLLEIFGFQPTTNLESLFQKVSQAQSTASTKFTSRIV